MVILECVMVWNKLITTLRGQGIGRDRDCASANQADAPANSTKHPGLIELPSDKESVFVVEQISL